MPLIRYAGGLLRKAGKLVTDLACCCGWPPLGCCCIDGNMFAGYTAEECAEAGGELFTGERCNPPAGCGCDMIREYCNDGECVKPNVTVSYCGLSVDNTTASGPPEESVPFDEGGQFGGYRYGNATDGGGLALNPGYRVITRCNDYCIELLVYIAIDFSSRTYRCLACFSSGSTATCTLINESTSESGRPLPCAGGPTVTINWAP